MGERSGHDYGLSSHTSPEITYSHWSRIQGIQKVEPSILIRLIATRIKCSLLGSLGLIDSHHFVRIQFGVPAPVPLLRWTDFQKGWPVTDQRGFQIDNQSCDVIIPRSPSAETCPCVDPSLLHQMPSPPSCSSHSELDNELTSSL
jgi:hypothetical protein